MEEVVQSTELIFLKFSEIEEVLIHFKDLVYTASYDLLKSTRTVVKSASGMIKTRSFSSDNLNELIGAWTSFNRHLSDIEQSVYEENGEQKVDRIILNVKNTEQAYTIICEYLDNHQ